MEKLKNEVYNFEVLNTLEKNATKLGDEETLGLIAISRASKTAPRARNPRVPLAQMAGPSSSGCPRAKGLLPFHGMLYSRQNTMHCIRT